MINPVIFVVHLANTNLQPCQDPALGDVHGTDRHRQVLGHLLARLAFNRRLPERLPGCLLKFSTDLLGHPVKQTMLVVSVPLFVIPLGLLFENRACHRVTTASRVSLESGKEVVDSVASDRQKPAPKPAT